MTLPPSEPLLSALEYLCAHGREPNFGRSIDDFSDALYEPERKAKRLAAEHGAPVDYIDCWLEYDDVRWCIRMLCTTPYVWSLVYPASADKGEEPLQGL